MRLGDGSAFSTKAHWIESATAILTQNGWKPEMLHFTKIKNE